MVKLLAERAPAKINLFLRVVGRRVDGYHELDSVFIPVSLCDDVRVEVRGTAQSGVPTTLALACDRGGIPPGDQNLAWRARSSTRLSAAIMRSTAPASLEPPPRPAPAGIFLRRSIAT